MNKKLYKYEVWAYSVDKETGYRDGDGIYTVVELPNHGAARMVLERMFSWKKGWDFGGFIPYTTEEEAEQNAIDFYAELEARKERMAEDAA